MRGLIKRDDPKLQASVHTHQVLLGSCLTAHASGASLSLWGSCRCACMCAMSLMPRRLLVAVELQHAPSAEAFIRWRHAVYSSPFLSQPRASLAARLLASSSCALRSCTACPCCVVS